MSSHGAVLTQREAAMARLGHLNLYLQSLEDFLVAGESGNFPNNSAAFAETLHRSFLVTLCMVLESELKNYTALLAAHLTPEREIVATGSVLDKFKKNVTKVYGIALPLDQQLWQELRGLYQLRTTLLHDDGHIATLSARKRSLLETFALQNSTLTIVADQVVLDRATCDYSLIVVTNFLAVIYSAAEQHFHPAR